MADKYKATFEIDCGVSPGFGVKYSDKVTEEKEIEVSNSKYAVIIAMVYANDFADNYLSNPETGFTTVTLSKLEGPDGEVSFNKDKAIVKRSTLEHILSLPLNNKE